MMDSHGSTSGADGLVRSGSPPPDIASLARVDDRLSFLYFEQLLQFMTRTARFTYHLPS